MMSKTNGPPQPKRDITLTPIQLSLVLAANLLILLAIWITGTSRESRNRTPDASDVFDANTATADTTLETTTPGATATPPVTATPEGIHTQGLFETPAVVMSLLIDGYANLYSYDLNNGQYIQLTDGGWNDVQPEISPDGRSVAFASDRSGYWDIYTLNLTNGQIQGVTGDNQYDGAPTWSPDGTWIAYETYLEDNLEIAFTMASGRGEPIQLTIDAANDHSPAWSPAGRVIAFVSDRGGAEDIWRIDLDDTSESRIQNFTKNPLLDQRKPSWSGDGKWLAWTSSSGGIDSIYYTEYERGMQPRYATYGQRLLWGQDGKHALTPFFVPENHYIALYQVEGFSLVVPAIKLPGQLEGADWGAKAIPSALPSGFSIITAEELAKTQAGKETAVDGVIFGRQFTLPLGDVEAPHAELSALALEPFFKLRDRVAQESGWDVLSSLEQAFVPITQPLEPGREMDWLYTGRAFSLPITYMDVGWMVVAKEQYGGKVYWRVFIRAAKQDGSQGKPLTQKPWNFQARFTSNTDYYEQGGAAYPQPPAGYWVDFTALAQSYGWERFSALSNWQTYFFAARFNEFAITSGLDWEAAMLQLYPPEILETPGAVRR